jgi:uncharacterized protein YbjT (DUF2867 family)
VNVLVCGASGCIGRAVAQALRWRGHQVVAASRGAIDGSDAMALDFMRERSPAGWAAELRARRIDAVVNCVGILMPGARASFARVHTEGPIELFRGAAVAGVARVVQVSALGIRDAGEEDEADYLRSKRLADEALLDMESIDAAVVRPSLVFGPGSASAALFAALASLPVIGLPGTGAQRLQPIHVLELAEIVAGLVERTGSARGVYELGGKEPLDYRRMLESYRRAQGLGEAIWLPVPMPLMELGARLAELVPQRVFSRDTLRLLARGNLPSRNAAPALLGRAPSGLDEGLAVTPPRPLFETRVDLAAPVELGLRVSLAFLWIYTAAISAWLPERSGVLELLARCGFEGAAGQAALAASCALNLTLGTLLLVRPSVLLYAVQSGAVVGYTLTAAVNVPELTIDHCAPLIKNLPVLACVIVLWLAEAGRPSRHAGRAAPAGIAGEAAVRPRRPSPRFRPATRDVPA